MLYIVNKNKYANLEREVKQTSLNFVKIQKLRLENGYIYRSQFSENHTLLLVVSGSILFNNERIESGNTIYISKFAAFKFNAVENANIIEINFDYSENISLFNKTHRIIKTPLEVKEYVDKIYCNKFFTNSLAGVTEGLLLNVLNSLNILCDSYSVEISLYQKCREWIEQNATGSITAEDAANAMNYTVAHLNRVLKKHSGKCLSTLINERKISEIKQLIKISNCSTKDIAQKLYFESPELLRKFFKYHTGISIKEYRMKLM